MFLQHIPIFLSCYRLNRIAYHWKIVDYTIFVNFPNLDSRKSLISINCLKSIPGDLLIRLKLLIIGRKREKTKDYNGLITVYDHKILSTVEGQNPFYLISLVFEHFSCGLAVVENCKRCRNYADPSKSFCCISLMV